MVHAVPDRRGRNARYGWGWPVAAAVRPRGIVLALLVEVALLALAAAPLPARAADARPAWTPPPLPPCTCRAAGRVFDMGEEACLATADGPRLAVCAMDQNVTSWKPTARTCPSADRHGGTVHPAS